MNAGSLLRLGAIPAGLGAAALLLGFRPWPWLGSIVAQGHLDRERLPDATTDAGDGIQVTGVLRSGDGTPLAGVELVLSEDPEAAGLPALRILGDRFTSDDQGLLAESHVGAVVTDASGRFAFESVWPGEWAIGPGEHEKDFPRVVRCFAVAPEDPAFSLDLRLDRGLGIRGVVLDPEGQPLEDALLGCRGDDVRLEFVRCGSPSGKLGAFELRPLPAGRYLVTATSRDPFYLDGQVAVRTGGEPVELRLRWGGALSGSVVDEETGERAAAFLSLDGTAGWSTAEGFRFARLAPGRHDLFAFAGGGRVGALRGLVVREREELEGLQVNLARGAHVRVLPVGPERDVRWFSIVWEGLTIFSRWPATESVEFAVPLGRITVTWWSDVPGGMRVHEEVRDVSSTDEPITMELPR